MSSNIGIVTATHELIIDIQAFVDGYAHLARNSHTTYVTATEEGTYVTGEIDIVIRVTVGNVVKHDARLLSHGDTFHILSEGRNISQIQCRVVIIGISIQVCVVYHTLTIVAEIYIINNDV